MIDSHGYVDFGRPADAPSLGVGAVVTWSDAWSTRLTVDRGRSGDVPGRWFCAPFVVCPSVLIRVNGELTTWTLGGDVLFSPSVPNPVAGPTLFVGAGIRHRDLGWDSPNEQVPIPTRFARTDLVARLGLRAARTVGRVELHAEVRSDFGRFGAGEERFIEGSIEDGRVTNVDVGVSLGVGVRLH